MPDLSQPGPVNALAHVAVESVLRVEVSLPSAEAAFHASLIRTDCSYFDDDPTPDIGEHVVCEHDFSTALPAVFGAVDEWLFQGHKLRVLAHTWTPCESGPDVGVALLLEARAVPVQPLPRPLVATLCP